MRKIVVLNPKGGCGKSTVAIHLASWLARCDEIVCLGDLDPQRSAADWLERRDPTLPPIRLWDPVDEALSTFPADCAAAIVDTPAGLHGKQLKRLLNEADRIVVPVLPSLFDMLALRAFFGELAQVKAVRKDRVRIATIAMRVDPQTLTSRELLAFLARFELPFLTAIRRTQRYVHAAEIGKTIFDTHGIETAQDREQWRPLLDWIRSRR